MRFRILNQKTWCCSAHGWIRPCARLSDTDVTARCSRNGTRPRQGRRPTPCLGRPYLMLQQVLLSPRQVVLSLPRSMADWDMSQLRRRGSLSVVSRFSACRTSPFRGSQQRQLLSHQCPRQRWNCCPCLHPDHLRRTRRHHPDRNGRRARPRPGRRPTPCESGLQNAAPAAAPRMHHLMAAAPDGEQGSKRGV